MTHQHFNCFGQRRNGPRGAKTSGLTLLLSKEEPLRVVLGSDSKLAHPHLLGERNIWLFSGEIYTPNTATDLPATGGGFWNSLNGTIGALRV